MSGDDVRFGRAMRRVRRARGMTLQAVADRCTFTIDSLSKMERGCRRIALADAVQTADALGCSVTDFVTPALPEPNVWEPPAAPVETCSRCKGSGREPSATGMPQIGAPSCLACSGTGDRVS